MRRLALPLLAAALFAGCGDDAGTPAAGGDGQLASLVVTVDDDGEGGAPPRELKLTCAAPTDSTACGAAAGISTTDLAPTPGDTACAELYGGPETATIKGEIRGNPVDASFSRTNACEIARWDGVEPLLAEVP